MEKFVIHGCKPLEGSVSVSGSKNAALPILAACLLTEKTVVLNNVPHLSDVFTMCEILADLGCNVEIKENTVFVTAANLRRHTVPHKLAGQLRGSFLVMGPLLARLSCVRISMPGGCAIGARPVDLHIKGLCALGTTKSLYLSETTTALSKR